jgi:iron complex transport system substrate-binding protein
MKSPERIVSLISSATEILYLLGLADRVVGVSHECDYPGDVSSKPRLTRSLVESCASSLAIDEQVRSFSSNQTALYSIDVEQLTELAPDLIVTQAQCDVCAVRYEDVVSAVRTSPEISGTAILALDPRSLADVLDDITRIGRATGADGAAAQARASLEARVRSIQTKIASLPHDEICRVACLEWIDPPMLAANWMPDMIRWAGGDPGHTAAGQHSSYASWEQIVADDPQVIIVMPCGFDLERAIVEAQVLAGKPGWEQLSAVRNRRVFAVDGNAYFNRSGPRLVDSLEILAHLFHPEAFAPPFSASCGVWCRLKTRNGSLISEPL